MVIQMSIQLKGLIYTKGSDERSAIPNNSQTFEVDLRMLAVTVFFLFFVVVVVLSLFIYNKPYHLLYLSLIHI